MSGALAGFAVGALWEATAASVANDERVLKCGLAGEVEAVFDIAEGRALWQHLPAMKRAPELEVETKPISVVVYQGTVNALVFGPAGASRTAEVADAVCVLLSDGERVVYGNVSRAGFQAP